MNDLLSVEDALARVLSLAHPLGVVEQDLQSAAGMVLAEDIRAAGPVPPHDNSALDGYALRAADIAPAGPQNPIRLEVIYEQPAGSSDPRPIGPGQAVRIMTGAPIPFGADTVVGFEDTDRVDWGRAGDGLADQDRSTVAVLCPAEPGEAVRRAGEDLPAGSTALTAGCVLTPGAIGVAASLGRIRVPVRRRPRVAIVPTGDEVVEIDTEPRAGQIRNNHAWALEALVAQHGGQPQRRPIVADRLDSVRVALLGAAAESDLVLTIGGVSVGDHDLVKHVIGQHDIDFWRIRMKPGKPLAAGRIAGTPVLGLPGNPVSGLVVFELFGRPLLLAMQGRTDHQRPLVRARASASIPGDLHRRTYARVLVWQRDGEFRCRPTGAQGSGVMSSLARADALAVIPEGCAQVAAGQCVEIQMLNWPGIAASAD
jgi:molybdopterin molybdotransferase